MNERWEHLHASLTAEEEDVVRVYLAALVHGSAPAEPALRAFSRLPHERSLAVVATVLRRVPDGASAARVGAALLERLIEQDPGRAMTALEPLPRDGRVRSAVLAAVPRLRDAGFAARWRAIQAAAQLARDGETT